MSRCYLTLSMPHNKFGIGLPTLSFDTNDATGGGYDIGGLHPATIATLLGQGPEVKKQERFDLKLNLNRTRTALTLVINSSKHLPHWEWSSDGGAGKMPLAAIGTLATQILKGDKKGGKGERRHRVSEKDDDQSPSSPASPRYTSRDGRRRRRLVEDNRRLEDRPSRRSSRDRYSSLSSAGSSSSRESRRSTRDRCYSSPSSAGSSSSSRDSRRYMRQEALPPTSQHALPSSRDSSHYSDRSRRSGHVARRAASRKRDRDYDSAYASGTERDASVDTWRSGNSSSRHGHSRSAGSSRRERFDC